MARAPREAYGGNGMTGRTARMLGATAAAIASALVPACTATAAAREHYTRAPRTASVNSSSGIPLNVEPTHFKTLTTLVAGHWQIPIDGDTLATPGVQDGVDSIGFSSTVPENVLGAYIYWPRRLYQLRRRCVRRVCKRVRRYVRTDITEADVAFSTAFPWNEGPGYPAADAIDLPTVEFHELGHFHDPNRPHGHRCSGSPLTESLGYGEWWRSRTDWYEQCCTNAPSTRAKAAAVAPSSPIFARIVHQLPDRIVGRNRP
jgi:hypothetical protein